MIKLKKTLLEDVVLLCATSNTSKSLAVSIIDSAAFKELSAASTLDLNSAYREQLKIIEKRNAATPLRGAYFSLLFISLLCRNVNLESPLFANRKWADEIKFIIFNEIGMSSVTIQEVESKLSTEAPTPFYL